MLSNATINTTASNSTGEQYFKRQLPHTTVLSRLESDILKKKSSSSKKEEVFTSSQENAAYSKSRTSFAYIHEQSELSINDRWELGKKTT